MSTAAPAAPTRRLPLRLLGELQVGAPGAPRALPASRKTRALLAYLAVAARRHLRSELCTLFWEDAADPRAALRWSLTQIRNALRDSERGVIRADRESVHLHAARIATDIGRLDELTRRAPRAGLSTLPRARLLDAAALFRGEFLEGLDLPACYAYHEWCMAERETASRRHEQILEALIEHDRSEPQQVLAHAHALVARNPLNEHGHIELMRALAALGRNRDAQAQYAQCCRIFEAELGLGPPARLRAALAAFDSGRPPQDDAHDGMPLPITPAAATAMPATAALSTPAAPVTPVADARARPPLVGRGEEVAQLAACLARAAQGRAGDVLLISGVPGIGTSRLLEELAHQAVAKGGRTLRGRAYEAERQRPFGFWIDALRGLGQPGLPPALDAALQPLTLAGAAGVEVGDRERLFDAACAALSWLAQAGPVAVLVDDLQWIEDSSAALLHYAMRQFEHGAVLFAFGARAGELEDNAAAQQLIAALAQARRLRRIALGPLREDDARALVRAVAQADDVERIVAGAQGHPLMLLELARASDAPDSPEASTPLLERILHTRLARLSVGAGELLGWASAFGHAFPLEGLIAVTGGTPGATAAALSELERHDLIAAAGDAGYEFSHGLVRQAAYSRISQPRRRLMHKAVALRLARDMERQPEAGAEVAHHAALGGQHELAARACVLAGERGLRMFANREAAELARRGLRNAAHVADKVPRARLAMALLRIQVLATSGQPLARLRPTVETLAQAIAEARDCRLHAEVAQGHYLLSVVHQEAGDIDAARGATLQAAEAAGLSDRLGRARQLANSARCLVELGRDIGQARALVTEAQGLADAAGVHEIEVRWCRALLHHWDGELEPALREIDRAIVLATEAEDRWRQGRCLAAAALIELERHAPAPALARAMALGEAAGPLDDGADAPLASALAALARRMAGDEAAPTGAAIEALRAADDKSRLAAVLTLAAAIELERGDGSAAAALASDALATANAIGDADAAAVGQALLVQAAATWGEASRQTSAIERVRAVLCAPQGFSARAVHAAEAAAACLASERGAAMAGAS